MDVYFEDIGIFYRTQEKVDLRRDFEHLESLALSLFYPLSLFLMIHWLSLSFSIPISGFVYRFSF